MFSKILPCITSDRMKSNFDIFSLSPVASTTSGLLFEVKIIFVKRLRIEADLTFIEITASYLDDRQVGHSFFRVKLIMHFSDEEDFLNKCHLGKLWPKNTYILFIML